MDRHHIDLTYLRSRSLRTVLLCLLGGWYLWVAVLFWSRAWFADWGWGPVFLIVGVIGGFLLQAYGLLPASLAVLVGLSAALVSSVWNGDRWIAPYLLSTVGGLAGLLFGPAASVSAAAICAVAVAAIGLTRWDVAPTSSLLLSPVLVILVTSLVSALAVQNLFHALSWFRERAIAAQKNEEQARERQGQLGMTLKALDEAYRRLEFANYDLARARESAEKARATKQAFAARVSHELRTPLNIISAFSEIMYHTPHRYYEGLPSARFRADTHELYRSSRHLLHLVNDVLDLTRVEVHKMRMDLESAVLKPVVQESLDMIRPLVDETRVSLKNEVSDSLPLVQIDRARIQQVLLNLLNNARRFTDQGSISVAARTEGDHVKVTVADTGIGIAPHDQADVFKEFSQVESALAQRNAGSGLGLAISRRFVGLHGGHIWVESEGVPGTGTRFIFTLPLANRPVASGSQVLPSTPLNLLSPTRRGRTLVLVDDDPEVAAQLEQRLRAYVVERVGSIEQAVEAVERTRAQAVLVNEESGAELDAYSRQGCGTRIPLPIIACSLVSEKRIGQALGVSDYLVKPITREALMLSINKVGKGIHRILIVDNEPEMANLLTAMLQVSGRDFEITIAAGGRACLDIIRRRPPDLVLLDLMMPEVSGYEVLREIQALGLAGEIRVIAVTGQTRTLDEERALGSDLVWLQSPGGLTNGEVLDYVAGLLDAIPPRQPALEYRSAIIQAPAA